MHNERMVGGAAFDGKGFKHCVTVIGVSGKPVNRFRRNRNEAALGKNPGGTFDGGCINRGIQGFCPSDGGGQAQNRGYTLGTDKGLIKRFSDARDVPHLAGVTGVFFTVKMQFGAGHGKHALPVGFALFIVGIKPDVAENIEHDGGLHKIGGT